MIDRLADYWSSKKPKSSKLWRYLSLSLTVMMVAYLAYSLTQGKLRLDRIDWKAYGGAISASMALYLASLILQFIVWARIIFFHHKTGWEDVSIFARTILMRSLPGGAWHWVGRISMYSGGGEVSTRVVIAGNFLEWALITLSGLMVFFATLIGWPRLLAVFAACAALALAVFWQPAERKWAARLVEAILWIVLYSLMWALAAGILYLMTKAVAGSGYLSEWESLKVWTLTGSLSMLVTMLPSSLGIREVTLVWMLQSVLNPSIALLIALMLRIIYTLADVVWGMAGWAVSSLILYRLKRSI
ncbi:MAG: hypothetical protein Fur0035_01180 [Anaerolineales bacterium]